MPGFFVIKMMRLFISSFLSGVAFFAQWIMSDFTNHMTDAFIVIMRVTQSLAAL